MYEKIKEQFKELGYLLSMDNSGQLNKVIAELEYVENLYDEMKVKEEDKRWKNIIK